MKSFALNYWKKGSMERVYINNPFINGLNIYLMGDGRDERPRVFGSQNRFDYPAPYDGADLPADAVARDALEQYGVDPDDFTWDDLMEVVL